MDFIISSKKVSILAQHIDNIKASVLTQIRIFVEDPNSALSIKVLVERVTRLMEELNSKVIDLGTCGSEMASHVCRQSEEPSSTRAERAKNRGEEYWKHKKMLY
jgi:hypothetical protein